MGKRHQEFVETNKALFDLESISHLEHSLSKLQLNVICVARGQDETSDFSNFINLQRLEFSKDCGFNPQYDLELPPLLQVLQLNEDFTAGLGRLPLSLEIVICSEDYIDLEYLVLWTSNTENMADRVALTEFFYWCDTNKDSLISVAEIRSACAVDVNNDGSITATEVDTGSAPWLALLSVQDMDSDQLISLGELLIFNNITP